jgi:hypothetical protein
MNYKQMRLFFCLSIEGEQHGERERKRGNKEGKKIRGREGFKNLARREKVSDFSSLSLSYRSSLVASGEKKSISPFPFSSSLSLQDAHDHDHPSRLCQPKRLSRCRCRCCSTAAAAAARARATSFSPAAAPHRCLHDSCGRGSAARSAVSNEDVSTSWSCTLCFPTAPRADTREKDRREQRDAV